MAAQKKSRTSPLVEAMRQRKEESPLITAMKFSDEKKKPRRVRAEMKIRAKIDNATSRIEWAKRYEIDKTDVRAFAAQITREVLPVMSMNVLPENREKALGDFITYALSRAGFKP